jgi:hypothetical protein
MKMKTKSLAPHARSNIGMLSSDEINIRYAKFSVRLIGPKYNPRTLEVYLAQR